MDFKCGIVQTKQLLLFKKFFHWFSFLVSLFPFRRSNSVSYLLFSSQRGIAIIGAHYLPRSRSFGSSNTQTKKVLKGQHNLSSFLNSSLSSLAVICHDPALPFLTSVNLLPLETGSLVKWRVDYRDPILAMCGSSRLFVLVSLPPSLSSSSFSPLTFTSTFQRFSPILSNFSAPICPFGE